MGWGGSFAMHIEMRLALPTSSNRKPPAVQIISRSPSTCVVEDDLPAVRTFAPDEGKNAVVFL